MEVELPSAEEVAAIEAEGRAVLDEIQRRGVAAVLGEIAVDPYPGAESRNPASSRAPLPDLGGDEGSDGVS